MRRRLVADVPVGTCLSGGLDSSSIVTVMNQQLRAHVPDAASMGDRLKTFSAIFDNDPIDEREYIAHVLEATDAEGNFVRPSSSEFVDELPRVVWYADEPMVSTGPYAQWCVMRLAAGKVKVLLDGQGGDELLAGYTPYHFVYLRELLRRRQFIELTREAWRAQTSSCRCCGAVSGREAGRSIRAPCCARSSGDVCGDPPIIASATT